MRNIARMPPPGSATERQTLAADLARAVLAELGSRLIAIAAGELSAAAAPALAVAAGVDRLLSVDEVASVLGKSRARVWELCRRPVEHGGLLAVRDGRGVMIPESALNNWIEARKRSGLHPRVTPAGSPDPPDRRTPGSLVDRGSR